MISKEIMSDIVFAIIESADEIKSKNNLDSQDFGQLLAYAESLTIIKEACGSEDLADIGLDFDIEKKYLL